MYINQAFADASMSAHHVSNASAVNMVTQLMMLAGLGLLFYFLIWRPQSQRAREQQELLAALKVGDEVSTRGGLMGKIYHVHPQWVQLEISSETKAYVQKQAITHILPKGTLHFK